MKETTVFSRILMPRNGGGFAGGGVRGITEPSNFWRSVVAVYRLFVSLVLLIGGACLVSGCGDDLSLIHI